MTLIEANGGRFLRLKQRPVEGEPLQGVRQEDILYEVDNVAVIRQPRNKTVIQVMQALNDAATVTRRNRRLRRRRPDPMVQEALQKYWPDTFTREALDQIIARHYTPAARHGFVPQDQPQNQPKQEHQQANQPQQEHQEQQAQQAPHEQQPQPAPIEEIDDIGLLNSLDLDDPELFEFFDGMQWELGEYERTENVDVAYQDFSDRDDQEVLTFLKESGIEPGVEDW